MTASPEHGAGSPEHGAGSPEHGAGSPEHGAGSSEHGAGSSEHGAGSPEHRSAGLRASEAHVFVDDLDRPELDAGDRHHLERVLRLDAGDRITASDGRGGWRWCVFADQLEPAGDVIRVAQPEPTLTVGFAPVKGDRPEWVVQKLTELGVDRIVPFHSGRSVVHWTGERADRHARRLLVVAREAAMQSRRVWLPSIAPIADFAAVAALPAAALADPDGVPVTLAHPTVLIGPEGGWADDEMGSGLPAMAIGPTVLRAETAAVAMAALLTALRFGTVRPLHDHVG